ncbi:N-acetylmuramoyl-L-alanine amidase [Marininema mesophilum]|uniref:N-acetylmuramoyl-L-alanine amidase n=1 Tax=Marininema mesophilum TaxID=1048340 RepID=A0A1H3AWZ4_9BACL|nr:N-acetylmuramoyl-L-alanine amidase [Marininema mesophilum]SDX33938.1 N-acetylmuramoyl-L-alanine amidase [Marininema mesophilum]
MGLTIGLDYGHIDGRERRLCTEMAHLLAFSLQRRDDIKEALLPLTGATISWQEKRRQMETTDADVWLSFHVHPVTDHKEPGFASYIDCCAGLTTRSLQAGLHNGAAYILRQVDVIDWGKKNDTEAMPGSLPLLTWAEVPAVCFEWRYTTEEKKYAENPEWMRKVAEQMVSGLRPSVLADIQAESESRTVEK